MTNPRPTANQMTPTALIRNVQQLQHLRIEVDKFAGMVEELAECVRVE